MTEIRKLPKEAQKPAIEKILNEHGGKTYTLNLDSITCHTCGKTSYSEGDMHHRFCLYCGYHEDNARQFFIPEKNIDILVAERVMGFKKEPASGFDSCTEAYLKPRDSDAFEMVGCAHNLPPYSTSIEAAWEVLEKLKGQFELSTDSADPVDELRWQVYIVTFLGSQDGLPVEVRARAHTAPMAICRAALKAVGVELKD